MKVNSLVVCATCGVRPHPNPPDFDHYLTLFLPTPDPHPQVCLSAVSTLWDMWNCVTRQKLGRLSRYIGILVNCHIGEWEAVHLPALGSPPGTRDQNTPT